MRDGSLRYILLFLIAIGLVIFVVVLVWQSITGNSSNSDEAATDQQQTTSITSFADNGTTMRMTTEGPIVSEQLFKSSVITVGTSAADAQLRSGYTGNVSNQVHFANNELAYRNFLQALDLAGFTLATEGPVDNAYQAQCATGKRFIFDIINSSNATTARYWTTSCSNHAGNFSETTNTNSIISLFEAQIPNYNQFTTGTGL